PLPAHDAVGPPGQRRLLHLPGAREVSPLLQRDRGGLRQRVPGRSRGVPPRVLALARLHGAGRARRRHGERGGDDVSTVQNAADEARGPWIQTYTGRRFYVTAPRPEDVCIEDVAHALSNICRFTGHT